MQRAVFLSRLRQGLWGLSPALIEDIVIDYDAHFAEGVAAGRNEEDVAAALGDPLGLAGELQTVSKPESEFVAANQNKPRAHFDAET